MSRWSADPERAANELILRSLDAVAPHGRILAVNQSGALPAALQERGLRCSIWNRRLPAEPTNAGAAAWPSSGPFDLALLRIPKAKDELEMAAHACLGALDTDGRLVAYGGNDEGIRAAGALLAKLCGHADTLAARGHGRVVAGKRPRDTSTLRTTLADWRHRCALEIAGSRRDWISYPGVFADRRIDEGTALLVGALPALHAGARVLDYACGSGIIAFAAQMRQQSLRIEALDNDAVALAAMAENLPTARPILGTRLAATGTAVYDAILSNPPLHAGISERHDALDALIADAPRHLAGGGVFQIVVQRRVPLDRDFAASFGSPAIVVAETGRFRVWRATRT